MPGLLAEREAGPQNGIIAPGECLNGGKSPNYVQRLTEPTEGLGLTWDNMPRRSIIMPSCSRTIEGKNCWPNVRNRERKVVVKGGVLC